MKLVVRAFRRLIKTVESDTRIASRAIKRLRMSLFALTHSMAVVLPPKNRSAFDRIAGRQPAGQPLAAACAPSLAS
ncbi:hypothetical protein Ate02nite_29740 [Paractinoplanes tereljensis]|uniref:Transposase n=1 Tax=Paractinoplanes tereljensis TaxID=571912 RepID=A0A919NK62_9ACTN|nr:hypothetical protein Ate02nite_29740 [Actinoplanes tereljensis]